MHIVYVHVCKLVRNDTFWIGPAVNIPPELSSVSLENNCLEGCFALSLSTVRVFIMDVIIHTYIILHIGMS